MAAEYLSGLLAGVRGGTLGGGAQTHERSTTMPNSSGRSPKDHSVPIPSSVPLTSLYSKGDRHAYRETAHTVAAPGAAR